MTVRYLVQDTFAIPGRGPVLTGLLTEGQISNGDVLVVEGTSRPVRISFVDFHQRQTPEGPVIGLEIHQEDAGEVTRGTVLVSPVT
ncbi:hypothetical protein [Klenkia sp. PcliD-1-E]|uniref:hypothetical protein n=1 Tax=Klenkia sp. PcliD-1-E TaxID=2954492 RepID=UPI002096F45B|nr:hypothetical protein [Klenkia sp. PcliD-1-E]MCO7222495.1 hypothetical protein [Klenkia sp. PcliD-1-E]